VTEAEKLIEDAERKARALVEETRREVEAFVADAAREGETAGAAQAAHMRAEIATLEARMLKEVEGEVVRASMRVARELLAAELAERADAIVDVAATALQAGKTAKDINLRAHPREAAVLREHKPRLVSVLTRAKDLEVREDRRVKPGGVVLETESGVIDAQLETQLDEIERVLSTHESSGADGDLAPEVG
jgi:type III secretion protein L